MPKKLHTSDTKLTKLHAEFGKERARGSGTVPLPNLKDPRDLFDRNILNPPKPTVRPMSPSESHLPPAEFGATISAISCHSLWNTHAPPPQELHAPFRPAPLTMAPQLRSPDFLNTVCVIAAISHAIRSEPACAPQTSPSTTNPTVLHLHYRPVPPLPAPAASTAYHPYYMPVPRLPTVSGLLPTSPAVSAVENRFYD